MRLMVDEARQTDLVLAWSGFVDRVEGWLLLVLLCPLAQRPKAPAMNSGPLGAHLGCPMGQDSQAKHFGHVGGSLTPLDTESQVLTGEHIDP